MSGPYHSSISFDSKVNHSKRLSQHHRRNPSFKKIPQKPVLIQPRSNVMNLHCPDIHIFWPLKHDETKQPISLIVAGKG
jgi:hypothetical protein